MSQKKETSPDCHFTWQITGKCNRHCVYCLRQRSDRPVSERTPDECRRILDDFLNFLRGRNFRASLEFSGGNPFVRSDLFDLIRRVRKAEDENLITGIRFLANPDTLTEKDAAFLYESGTKRFAVSLDGPESATDAMRGSGAYAAAVRGIPMLVKAGIPVFVKSTVTTLNYRDAGKTIDLALDLGADTIGFGELRQTDAAPDISSWQLTPAQYREYLLGLLAYRDSARPERRTFAEHAMRLGDGPSALLFHELGRRKEFCERMKSGPDARFGRPAGEMRDRILFVVWENGDVHPCNAAPAVGRMPEESLDSIFSRLGKETFQFGRRMFRRPESLPEEDRPEVCRSCPVFEECKRPSPLCWRKSAGVAR